MTYHVPALWYFEFLRTCSQRFVSMVQLMSRRRWVKAHNSCVDGFMIYQTNPLVYFIADPTFAMKETHLNFICDKIVR